MNLDIFIIIIITATIQSLFGVGVLLFGTPLLLLLGYPFMDSLLILLPISASINALQIVKDYKYIDKKIYKNILFITVPFIILFLVFVSKISLNINIIIGSFLIFIALKDSISFFHTTFEKILSYNKLFYSFMGIVHGLTNLGGALLTAKVFHTNLNKYEKRATTAVSYMTFAIFQIVTILFLDIKYEFSNLYYVLIGVGVYLLINKIIFHKISDHRYDKIFSIFLIMSGVSLVLKGLIW
jgi:hypothetical protein